MNRERLLEGAAFLENLQLKGRDQFDISSWHDTVIDREGNQCGTSACALGWMAYEKMWGLRLTTWGVQIPTDNGSLDGEYAGAAVFDIEQWHANWLFLPDYYARDPTKEDVAARMRHLAAGGTPKDWKGDL